MVSAVEQGVWIKKVPLSTHHFFFVSRKCYQILQGILEGIFLSKRSFTKHVFNIQMKLLLF